MSISIGFGDGRTCEVASNKGWSQVCRWVDDNANGISVKALVDKGVCHDAEDLADDVNICLALCDDDDVESVLISVLTALKGESGTVTVTNGQEA